MGIQLFSDLGGVFGLYLGMCIMSAVEMFEMICLLAFIAWRRVFGVVSDEQYQEVVRLDILASLASIYSPQLRNPNIPLTHTNRNNFQEKDFDEERERRRYEQALVTRAVEECKQAMLAKMETGDAHKDIKDIYAKLDRIEGEQQQKQQKQEELQQQVAEMQREFDTLVDTEE